MRILISGSNGLIGSELVPRLVADGHTVLRLVRSQPKHPDTELQWHPSADPPGPLSLERLGNLDAVIHLAGENIAGGRWNTARKERIRTSRVSGTLCLAQSVARLTPPPRVFLSASAVGFYGDRGDELLDENSSAGNDFLARVCQDWEAATSPAERHGIRVVKLRLGVVLSARGGALAKMLTPFRLGLGGRLGGGNQWMSWIAIDDVIGAIHHALHADALTGPINAVAPGPVTNAEFTTALGQVLRRPTVLPVPGFALRMVLGEMAGALLLASQRVAPRRLKETGCPFRYPELGGALEHALGLVPPRRNHSGNV